MEPPEKWTQDQIERELLRRMRDPAAPLKQRQLLRKYSVVRRGRQRYKEQRVQQMTTNKLLNAWAASPPEHPDKLIDLSALPDRQVVQALVQRDIGRPEDKALLADSAIAELTKRANAMQLTVAQYIRRRGGR
jgi:hypothetical protein